jgi:CRP/FNR family transcriptional regulator, cyclic AMP receptor protein
VAEIMWNTTGNGDSERRLVRVLDIDPDLGTDLDPDALRSATAELIAPVVPVEWVKHTGRWGPSALEGHLGLLVIRGLLLREVRLLGTPSAELLGDGDLLRPWDVDGEYTLPVPAGVFWTVLAPIEVAVLNGGFLRRAARWPEVLARLTGRTVARAKSLALHDAITNLKHVETRLLVQLWHLAERWGRVGPEGIALPLPLTHEMLAKLVGATRPSVTTGLGRLASRGLVKCERGGAWRLSHAASDALEPMPVEVETRLVS